MLYFQQKKAQRKSAHISWDILTKYKSSPFNLEYQTFKSHGNVI